VDRRHASPLLPTTVKMAPLLLVCLCPFRSFNKSTADCYFGDNCTHARAYASSSKTTQEYARDEFSATPAQSQVVRCPTSACGFVRRSRQMSRQCVDLRRSGARHLARHLYIYIARCLYRSGSGQMTSSRKSRVLGVQKLQQI
jgi:hypothetical protein